MKNNVTVWIFVLVISSNFLNGELHAQVFDKAAGLRLGSTSAITYKQYFRTERAIEFLLSARNEGVQLGALYMQHVPLALTAGKRFYLYYGLGGHMGTERYVESDRYYTNQGEIRFRFSEQRFFTIGVDGIAGIEYRVNELPLTLSLDIKPYLSFVGMEHIRGQFWDVAMGVKLRF